MVRGVPSGEPDVTVFRGIPYAAPPVGALRWRAPEPAPAWDGVRLADRFGASCPQQLPPGSHAELSEDCLTLNVWTGAGAAEERRPVFVWIYGGGFSGGSGSSRQFDGTALAKKGLVVVTFNYRLGALGFLATPELSRESGHGASGNYGLLDDIAVLQWVRDNIAAFGGDPGRVTIAGQSAGAGSVGFLAMSPLAKGLFHRGIAQSHARDPRDPELRYLSVSYRLLEDAERAGQRFAAERGAASLDALRALPWQELLVDASDFDAATETLSSAKPPLFRPVVDGWVVPDGYSRTYAAGMQNDVGFIAGNNLDETGAVPETAFEAIRNAGSEAYRPGAPPTYVMLGDYVAAARRKFGGMADEFLSLYPARNDEEAALASNEASRDNSRISTYLWAAQWSLHTRRPAFTYYWTQRPPGPDRDRRGAYHGSEIPYVFDNLAVVSRPWADADRHAADIMSSYWANFAATGDPNGPGLPEWPAYDAGTATVMQVGADFAPMTVAEPAKLDFWKRFFETQDPW